MLNKIFTLNFEIFLATIMSFYSNYFEILLQLS
jgi:hypothetical protein